MKENEGNFYLTCCGRFSPDISSIVPASYLISDLIRLSLNYLDKTEEFNGELVANEPLLGNANDNPAVIFTVKFKSMEELMMYRKSLS